MLPDELKILSDGCEVRLEEYGKKVEDSSECRIIEILIDISY